MSNYGSDKGEPCKPISKVLIGLFMFVRRISCRDNRAAWHSCPKFGLVTGQAGEDNEDVFYSGMLLSAVSIEWNTCNGVAFVPRESSRQLESGKGVDGILGYPVGSFKNGPGRGKTKGKNRSLRRAGRRRAAPRHHLSGTCFRSLTDRTWDGF